MSVRRERGYWSYEECRWLVHDEELATAGDAASEPPGAPLTEPRPASEAAPSATTRS